MTETVNVTISTVGAELLTDDAIKRAVLNCLAASQDRVERALDDVEWTWKYEGALALSSWAESLAAGEVGQAAKDCVWASVCFLNAAMVRPVFAICTFLDRMARS